MPPKSFNPYQHCLLLFPSLNSIIIGQTRHSHGTQRNENTRCTKKTITVSHSAFLNLKRALLLTGQKALFTTNDKDFFPLEDTSSGKRWETVQGFFPFNANVQIFMGTACKGAVETEDILSFVSPFLDCN